MSRATRPRDRTLFAFTSRASLNMSKATTRPLAELDIDDPDLTDEELDALLMKLAEEEAAERLGADEEDEEDDDSSKSANMGTLIAAVVGTVLLAASTFIVRKLRRKKAPPPANVPSDEPTILQAPGTSNNVVRRKKKVVKKKVVKKETAEKKACAHCGATEAKTASGKLLRCGRCKAVSFCSADCQKAHWPTHKSECKPAEAPAPAAPAAATAAATAPTLNAAAPAFVPPGSSTPAAPGAPPTDGNPLTNEPPSAAADPDGDDDAARRAALQERINNDRENMRKLQQLRIYLQAASQMFWRGEYRRAVEVLQQVAEKCHGIPSGEMMECEALRLCGHCLIRLKQFDAADRCLVMCMDVALKVEMPALIANVHIAQGQLASQREPPDYPKALKHHEAARVIARECEDISAEAAACLNCANTMGKMGDKERGMELQYEALGLRRKQVADAQLEIAEAKKILDENPPASTESVPEGTATQEQAAAAAATEDPTQVKRRRAMMDLANSKRSLQEARRAEAAALANVATAVAGADGDKARRATDAAALYEQSIEILRSEDSFTDKQLELAVVLNLANVYDNHVPNGHGTGVEYRRELDEMVRKNVQGKEGLPDVCGVCEERTNPLDVVRTSERGVDEDADDMTALTVLDCMHCHHTKCWTARKETGKGCPDCHRDEPDENAFV